MWLNAPNIGCVHGFSTRHGGISPRPYNTLNLGGSDDDPQNVLANRRLAFDALGLDLRRLALLRQVHGDRVCEALAGERQEGDALVSNTAGDIIAVLVADCYPVLFHDPVNRVIGAAHCGWRGTVASLAEKTILRMRELGADVKQVRVAIGQGISQENFEVGYDVIAQFREAGFPEACWNDKRVDLVKCILFTLKSAGIDEKNTWTMNRCTFEEDFFSHRRDKGRTGRMMGLISL